MNKTAYAKAFNTKLYEIVCTPVVEVPLDLPNDRFPVIVAAETSAEATRKVVAFFRNLFPDNGVKSIEVESFICSTRERIVVV